MSQLPWLPLLHSIVSTVRQCGQTWITSHSKLQIIKRKSGSEMQDNIRWWDRTNHARYVGELAAFVWPSPCVFILSLSKRCDLVFALFAIVSTFAIFASFNPMIFMRLEVRFRMWASLDSHLFPLLCKVAISRLRLFTYASLFGCGWWQCQRAGRRDTSA